MSQSTLDDYQDSGCIDHTNPETLRRLYWEEEMTLEEISDKSSVSSETIYYHMDKHGIERRNKKDALEGKQRQAHAGLVMNSNGYQEWAVRYKGENERVSVARLLAVAEYGFEAVKGNDVHHKNEVQWLDYPGNIEVLSPEEHTSLHSRGENAHHSKLSERDVSEIKYLLEKTDLYQKEIGDMYGVDSVTICNINTGETWSHIERLSEQERVDDLESRISALESQ